MVLFNKLELEIRDAGIRGHWGTIGEPDNVGNGLRIKGKIDGVILHCRATTPQETSSTLPQEPDTPKTNSDNNDTVLEIQDAGIGSNVSQESIGEPESRVGNDLRIESTTPEETTSTLPPVTDTPETHSDRKYL